MSNMAAVQRISVDQLTEVLARIQNQQRTELLALLGPWVLLLAPSRDDWSDPLKSCAEIFQLTGFTEHWLDCILCRTGSGLHYCA
jgi:hypothetical protein